jgi:hypothetical protein
MFLPIITNQELVDAHLATYKTRLVYLQKITEHNEPFMPTLMKASTYITVHYRNGTHAFIAAWTASNLRYAPYGKMWNVHVWQNMARHRRDVGSHYNRSHPSLAGLSCGTTMYGKT